MAKKKKDVRPSDARRLAARMGRQTEALLLALNAANLTLTLAVPCAVVELTRAEAVPGFVVTIFTVVLWMKLVSFAHCNYDLRRAPRAGQGASPVLIRALQLWPAARAPRGTGRLPCAYPTSASGASRRSCAQRKAPGGSCSRRPVSPDSAADAE